MSVPDVIPLFDSQSGSLEIGDDGSVSRNVTLRWLISGMTSYSSAEAKGEEIAPRLIGSHRRKNLNLDSQGNGFYLVSANYHNPAVNAGDGEGDGGEEPKPATFEFDTTGGTEHITQAYRGEDKTTAAGATGQKGYFVVEGAAPDTPVPNLDGAINVQGDQVQGVDVPVPAFTFNETWHFPSTFVLASYIRTLYLMTGRINSKPWRIFDAGEVKFHGARGLITQGQSSVAVNFNFTAIPNRTFTVGYAEITKFGHDHMSVQYETSEDHDHIIKRPKLVYIECTGPSGDFADLLIGNPFPTLGQPADAFAGAA
jgi:hypothetical protein